MTRHIFRLDARIAALAAGLSAFAFAQPASAQTSDLVSRSTLRVCADPADMPLSNEDGDGFENKLAELLAKDIGKPLVYTWFPQATGFYRRTLGEKRCDVVIGVAAGSDPYLNTNAYFRSATVLIVKKDGPLDGVDALSDPKLKDKRIGLIAGTPAASYLIRYGLMGKVRPYNLTVDRRYESPAEDMVQAVEKGDLDAAILWGPIAGYSIKKTKDLVMTPLVKEQGGPPMSYRITFGIRPGEENWKHRLNEFITKNQVEINKILASYNIPLLNEQDKPIEVKQ